VTAPTVFIGGGSVTAPTILGQTFHEPIGADRLEYLPLGRPVDVRIAAADVGAVCPVTGQPDNYQVTIRYRAVDRVLESKSLKMWLWGFRDVPISAEELAGRMSEELSTAAGTPVTVTVMQAMRGGMVITATGGAE
jgi:7-cyano-7-deazaguanine reductase